MKVRELIKILDELDATEQEKEITYYDFECGPIKVEGIDKKNDKYYGEDIARIEYEGEYCGKSIFMVNERTDEDFGKFILIS